MTSLLVRDAQVVVTMDADRREIHGGAVAIDGDGIAFVGSAAAMDAWIAADRAARTPARVIDARGCIVMPGLVNCHHHLFQTLTRAIGTGRGLGLFDWLGLLYDVWGGLDPDSARLGATLGLTELALSGATTVADHRYLFPNGSRLDDDIEAARAVGVRFHPTRGSMSLGQSQGGLPPDYLVETGDAILADTERVIAAFHDPAPRSMLRVGVAPCSPFSVSADLMRESACLARSYAHVGLHTHLAETLDEERFCIASFGKTPVQYAESLDWMGEDVWFAHMVHPSPAEIGTLARTRSGVCHCASSNMILASGIAPVRSMLDQGVRVGLGVDGSASNDSNHLLGEARQAMLLQRVGWPGFESRADRLSAREALEMATLGGARVLGRDDIGSLEAGKAADLVAFRVDGIHHSGAGGDMVAGLLTCLPASAWLSIIDGEIVVEDARPTRVDVEDLAWMHGGASRSLLQRAGLMR
jgi:cytosine/adenosine deaminase-related metal-dependent hydrolase